MAPQNRPANRRHASEFNEEFQFVHHSSNIHELVRLEVIDYDLVGANQILGFTYLKMGDLTIDQRAELNLFIRLREDEDPTGEISIVVRLNRLSVCMPRDPCEKALLYSTEIH